MISSSLATVIMLACGVVFALALNPFSGRKATPLRAGLVTLALAGAAIAALIQPGSVSRTGWLLAGIAAAAGAGAAIAMLSRLRASTEDSIAIVSGGAGLASILLAIAAYLSPDKLGIVHDGRLIGPLPLAAMAISLSAGAFALAAAAFVAGRSSGRIARQQQLAVDPNLAYAGSGLAVLLGIMLFAFDQPAALFWLSLLAGLTAGALYALPAGVHRLAASGAVLASAAGWSVAASGFMLGSLVMIIAGGLAGAAGATLALGGYAGPASPDTR